MIDLSINLKVERIDNGYLASGRINNEDIREFHASCNDLMHEVSMKLAEQVKEARQYEGSYDFTLKVEAHCEAGHD